MLDLIGAWALDACEIDEAAAVEAHLNTCPTCAAEARRLRSAAGWLGLDGVLPVPEGLRHRTLTAARAKRPPALIRTLLGAYAGQASLLDGLLDGVRPDDWQRADPRHETVTGVVAHLAGNDAMLAADLGLRVVDIPAAAGPGVRDAWWEQTQVLMEGLADEAVLDQPVRMASSQRPPLRPLRDALVQRAFETWIHLDDIRAVIGKGQTTPPPEQVRRIVELAIELLPGALDAHGAARPGHTVRLVLDGAGGGEWTFPMGAEQPGGAEVTIQADAVEFTRLVANRRSPDTIRHSATGNQAVSAGVLRVAAMLGCD
ncbi:hypothetical protein Prum_079580 [Phytohabitans rumicis]|uniref:Putative zinc-finger domain-containing protein n=2 Tax=Phytohabitans rumicis TaxID=1076125 RepID=A0A6V8LJG2_9ACTN|nr:hypothetical protein Prum_079580 [Phytohabitans rumicis]